MSSWAAIAKRIRVPLGFVFAAIYFWLARPTKMFLAIGVLIAAVGLFVRALASGHVKKNEALTTTGPYAYVRNPLYLGSLVTALGFVIASRNVWIGVLMLFIFILIYLPVIRAEETFLRNQFPEFRDYEQNVPRLFPAFKSSSQQQGLFSWDLYWKHREYNAVLGAVLMIAALAVKMICLKR